jgi:membrane-anchored protein YejM (alkaline phosphatase superfamily)
VVWGNGYLPASYQGTLFRSTGAPILDLALPKEVSRDEQRKEFDLIQKLNLRHLEDRPGSSELEARISAYELAFRMQSEAPSVVDLGRESEATKKMYGLDNPRTEGFGRQCLLARRLAERGVRYSLLIHGVEIGRYSWDDHGNIKERVPQHAAEVDQPIGALLKDLKQRGLLEETLVVWASEMGRTPFINDLKSDKPGRDHNQYGLVVWMAGGDIKGGTTTGQTDEFGIKALAEPIPLRDVHATILNVLGLDDRRLTYLHAGRFRKLTDIGGNVLKEIVA